MPLDEDCLEYLVDGKTKARLTKRYHDQVEHLRRFKDQIILYKQKGWVDMLTSIINKNGILFNSLLATICGINERAVLYTESLANEGIVKDFDVNVHSDIKKIYEFAAQHRIFVEDSFLHANESVSGILEQYTEIGNLDEEQLFQLEANMETLKNAVDENGDYAKGAVNKLKQTMKNFVDLTKKLATILHKLQLTIQLKVQNVDQQRKKVMIDLKKQITLCLNEISKPELENNIKLNVVGIKEEMQYAENAVSSLFKDIDDIISKRGSATPVASPSVQETITQSPPPIKLDLPIPTLKPLTINTKKSKVKELIDYFNQYTNIVTPRQLVNSAKQDITLRDLLKKDKINISSDEKHFVKTKINEFETCNIPKIPKGKKPPSALSKKPPKK